MCQGPEPVYTGRAAFEKMAEEELGRHRDAARAAGVGTR
jgi:hypothetical protein